MNLKSIFEVQSGLAPYAGAWTETQALHLVRRTMFGATLADVSYFTTRTMQQSVAELLTIDTTPPVGPINNYTNANTNDPDIPLGGVWAGSPDLPGIAFARRNSLRSWWTGLMLNQTRSAREKMVVFWHNHFGAGYEIIKVANHCYSYNQLLRTNAVGNLKALTPRGHNLTCDALFSKWSF